ncbi:multidrug efflux MFS transporter [Tessaracoccus sp. MC1627]|uniref:MDR family MFS transporter n=1 Tax=Tessaracoccus sp. MC1627 TaxID=2760312 RepID=UPI001603A166|nr:MDR family MFS transporter [Tessaracoccus sp. MC1627]MBB1513108.1 multidrug efflux MFS transporter [Tessaracoccus sp. MC1627]
MSTDMPRPTDRRVIPILLVAAFVVILNETTMNVALSSIMSDLGITERSAQWLTTAFMLTMAVVIPVTGWLLDRLPTRRVFVLALSLFSLGTLACAVAPSFGFLVLGRVIQATGTAIMMPLLMTTIMQLVTREHRGRVMGNVSMVISVAPAVGPTLSGVILQVASWRGIFWVVLPIALLMLWLGSRRLTNVGETKDTPLDLVSVPLTLLGFGPLVYGLSLVGSDEVEFWVPLLAIGIGVAGLAAFVARQSALQARGAALLDLRTFTYATFTVAVVMMAIAMMALFGTIIMLPLLLQRAFGLEPLQVGLMLLPGGIAMGLLSPVVGRLYDRVGPRALVVPASVVVMGVFVFYSTISLATPWWAIMLGHVVMSVGFASMFTPLFTVALGSLPRHLYSHGSAVVGTVQQVAGATGTAIFVTIFAIQSAAAAPTDASEAEALLVGARWAFMAAGAIWTAAVVAGLFLRKPADVENLVAAAH